MTSSVYYYSRVYKGDDITREYKKIMRIGKDCNESNKFRPEYSYLNKVYKSIGTNDIRKSMRKIINDGKYIVNQSSGLIAISVFIYFDKEFIIDNGYILGQPSPKTVEDIFDDVYSFVLRELGFNGGENILCASVIHDTSVPHLECLCMPVCNDEIITSNHRRDNEEPLFYDGTIFHYIKKSEYPLMDVTNFMKARYHTRYKEANKLIWNKLAKEIGEKYNIIRGVKFCNTELVADSNQKYTEALEVLENTKKEYEYWTNEVEKLKVQIDSLEKIYNPDK